MKSENKKNKKKKVSSIRTKELSLRLENLFKRLRKKGIAVLINLRDDERQQVFIWSQEVISQYATLLKKASMSIRDVKELPFLKKDIKMAIKILLLIYRNKSSDAEIETLRDLYVELGSFQDISKKDKEKAVAEHNTLLQEFNFYNTLILHINSYFEQ